MNFEAKMLKFNEISLGNEAEFKILVSEELIKNFANFSGDYNPLHMEEDYAKKTQFKGRIIHGMAIACFFSQLVGMYLPGKHCLYLSQTINFKKPIKIGEEVIIKGEVIDKVDSFKMLKIKTQALNKNGNVLIDGEAKVLVLEENNEIKR